MKVTFLWSRVRNCTIYIQYTFVSHCTNEERKSGVQRGNNQKMRILWNVMKGWTDGKNASSRPRVSTSPRPHVLKFPSPHFPESPRPQVPESPRPRVSTSLSPHVPTSPSSHVPCSRPTIRQSLLFTDFTRSRLNWIKSLTQPRLPFW